SGHAGLQTAIVLAWAGILAMAFIHFRLLFWNIREHRRFLQTDAYRKNMRGNRTEVQLLAAPLTVAMTINVGFVLGMVFVPGLSAIVEWLFPAAMVAFLIVGGWALRQLGDFWGRVLTESDCDCAADNSLAQALPAFALSMVGVGLAAPAGMSSVPATAAFSLALSSFFLIAAVITGAVMLVLGVRAMMEQNANPVSAPSLWIGVPVLTIIGITLVRQTAGIEAHFGAEAGGIQTLGLLTYFLAAQVALLLLGWVVLRRFNYFGRFVVGPERSAGSYTLVCPGVALAVMTHFFTNLGLAHHGVIEAYGVAYWALTAIALVVQAATIWLVFQLNRKHFRVDAWAGQRFSPSTASSSS
ncbi:MAG: hypothetical protein LLP51_11000, partial [Halorhodospira halophila]|uniref:TsoY family (seleno)protein n=1 Tax=Halorhodospira halophila TaxID=1053 RepID=UPI0026EB187C